MMPVAGVDHVTLCCAVDQLGEVQDFYERVLGLAAGARPPFAFSGRWLYAGNRAIVHLAAVAGEADVTPAAASPPAAVPVRAARTGPIDHIALRVDGPVDACRNHLRASGVGFSEAPVPGFPIHQLFLHDPLGVKIELNFALPS
nr:VOC family protein [uncultured Noviherbaspirillum sp.]